MSDAASRILAWSEFSGDVRDSLRYTVNTAAANTANPAAASQRRRLTCHRMASPARPPRRPGVPSPFRGGAPSWNGESTGSPAGRDVHGLGERQQPPCVPSQPMRTASRRRTAPQAQDQAADQR